MLLYLLDRERAARVASIPKKKSSSAKPAAVVEPGPPRSAFAERIRDQILGDSESEDEANSSAAKELRRKLGLPISDQRGRRGFRQGEGS